jgi:hypothetical protein
LYDSAETQEREVPLRENVDEQRLILEKLAVYVVGSAGAFMMCSAVPLQVVGLHSRVAQPGA